MELVDIPFGQLTLSLLLPLTLPVVLGMLGMVILLICSALVSGSEIAFFSLKSEIIDDLKEEKSRQAKTVVKLLKRPNLLLANILIANNFINVTIVILSTFLAQSMLDFTGYLWLEWAFQVVVVTALILFFGEVVPKILATQKPIQFAKRMSKTMQVLNTLCYPFNRLLTEATSVTEKRMAKKRGNLSIDEISDAIELTSKESTDDETRMLKGVVRFSDTEVKEIMRARVDVTAVDIEDKFQDLIAVILESGFSRIPVYKETFDAIQGVIYIKDLLPYLGRADNFSWKELIRPAYFVPENKPINDLLEDFREKKIHLAIIVDEYGGTSGIVTLEDVLEEIIGEISDEFDTAGVDVDYTRIDETTFIFEGKTSINDFCKITATDDDLLDEVKGEAESLAGLMLELSGRIPEKGEKEQFSGIVFTVNEVDQRRIKRIKVELPLENNSTTQEGDGDEK